MAYLARQRRGSRTYYYLVENISLGKGQQRKQVRKFIGDKLPSETKLQILIAKFEEEIKGEKLKLRGYYYLTTQEISEVEEVNAGFWKRYNAVNDVVRKQFDNNFVMAFVYNTNSIEGSTLTPREVELLLTENIAPARPLDDVLEAKSAEKTLSFIKTYSSAFDQDFVLQIHKLYFLDSKPGIAGKYKTHANRVLGSNFDTTPPEFVLTDMKLFFKEYEKLKKELHPLELAAWVHWKLVRIHPFQDGNGRTARILMNYVLHANGYGMIDIKTKEKQAYFKALEKCHYNNNGSALATRLVRRFKAQYTNALK